MACLVIGGTVGAIVGLVVASAKDDNFYIVIGGLFGVMAGVGAAVLTGTL